MPSRPAPRASDAGDKPKPAKPHPAVAQQKAYATSIAELELPKTSLVKLAKGSIPDNVKMQQDVAHALLRSSTVFISYLTATAHDMALDRSGRSITAGDVIKAITEMDFGPADHLVPILEQELAAYRAQVAAAKKAKAAGRAPAAKGKRRAVPQEEENDADVSMAVDGDDEDDEDEDGGEGEGEGEGDDGEGGEGGEGGDADEGDGDEGDEDEGEAGSAAE